MSEKLGSGSEVTVLVTGVGGRSVGFQILASLKLSRTPYRIVATDAEPFSFGLFKAEQGYLVPYADAPDYLPTIQDIVAREGVDVILPGTEAEVAALARHRDIIEEQWGATLIVADPTKVALCQDKVALSAWLDNRNLHPPRSADGSRADEFIKAVGFPIVAKPRSGSSGSRGVVILANEGELADYLATRPASSIQLQEYVGSPEREFTVGIVTTRTGEIVDSIVLKRSLTGMSMLESRYIDGQHIALSTGYSQGTIVDEPVVSRFCEQLVTMLGLVGPVNIQCRTDHENRVRVFEVHPRFSGSSSIRAEVGFNEADMLIRSWVGGEAIGRQPYLRDVAAIRAFQTLIVPVSEYDRLVKTGRR